MNIPALQNILVVRTDRIGDVVLSLPMIPALRTRFPDANIAFLLRSYTRALADGQPGLDRILLYDEHPGSLKPFGSMLAELRKDRFDAVVVTYPTFRLARLMYLAGIPIRVGTGYRWYSFLFNRRVYEHRKTAEKHEAEYNLSLLRMLDCHPTDPPKPGIVIGDDAERRAAEILRNLGLDSRPFVILHPGSGGSARDWKPERFGALAARLANDGTAVLVTGGPGEEELVEGILAASEFTAKALPRNSPLGVLAAVIRRAVVFVANSTGPLHMAAAVGTPVVAFYPPIRQCSSDRWGPLTDRKVVFEPLSADCPRCKGGPCEADECMDLISVEDVGNAVRSLMTGSSRGIASAS